MSLSAGIMPGEMAGSENGHYFLSNHGRPKEVNEGVFTYSLWHVRSLFITHALAMLAAWLTSRLKRQQAT